MRLKYIDSVKGFSMLLILWGHIVTFYDPLAHWASGFKVSLFYIVTGYLLALRRKDSEELKKTPLKKLIISSGVPYVFYSAISLVVAAVLMILRNEPFSFFSEKLFSFICLSGISTLWFLPSIFFGRLLFERVYCVKGFRALKISFLIVTPVILCASTEMLLTSALSELLMKPMNVIIKAVAAWWFISVGFEGERIVDKLKEKGSRKAILTALCLVSGSALSFINRNVDFNNISLGSSPVLFFVGGVLCSFGIIGVFSFLTERLPCALVQFAGKNSLFIMVSHMPLYIVPVALLVFEKLISGEGTALSYLRAAAVFASVLVLEWLLIRVKAFIVGAIEKRTESETVKTVVRSL